MTNNPVFGASLRQLDLLVLEPAAGMQQVLKSLFSICGVHHYRMVAEAGEALAEMEVDPPNLVIVNWADEVRESETLLRIMRAPGREPLCYIPAIVLCSAPTRKSVMRAVALGVSHFLIKPISANMLRQRFAAIARDERDFITSGDTHILEDTRTRLPEWRKMLPKMPVVPAPCGQLVKPSASGANAAAPPRARQKIAPRVRDAVSPDTMHI